MPDGPDQEARDAAMAAGKTDWSYRPITWLYAHDAGVLPDTMPETTPQSVPAPH
jgi:salicylate hydroxylase